MNKEEDNDLEFARQNYYDLLSKGSEALEEMIEVARATEHPRAFEVLSGMMKNVADINNSLVDLHKKKAEIQKSNNNSQLPENPTTTNNLFVGSTADLQKLLATNSMKDITPDGSESQ